MDQIQNPSLRSAFVGMLASPPSPHAGSAIAWGADDWTRPEQNCGLHSLSRRSPTRRTRREQLDPSRALPPSRDDGVTWRSVAVETQGAVTFAKLCSSGARRRRLLPRSAGREHRCGRTSLRRSWPHPSAPQKEGRLRIFFAAADQSRGGALQSADRREQAHE